MCGGTSIEASQRRQHTDRAAPETERSLYSQALRTPGRRSETAARCAAFLRVGRRPRNGSTAAHARRSAGKRVRGDLVGPFEVTLAAEVDARAAARAALAAWMRADVVANDAHGRAAARRRARHQQRPRCRYTGRRRRQRSCRDPGRRPALGGGRRRQSRYGRPARTGPPARRRLRAEHRRCAFTALGRRPRRRHPRVGGSRHRGGRSGQICRVDRRRGELAAGPRERGAASRGQCSSTRR
jgi:hypothetical protein